MFFKLSSCSTIGVRIDGHVYLLNLEDVDFGGFA